jgi:ATPase family associated with various cellular activities (AAA)
MITFSDDVDFDDEGIPYVSDYVSPISDSGHEFHKTMGRWDDTDHPHIWLGLKGSKVRNIHHTSVAETDFDTQAMMDFFKENPVDNHVRFDRSYNLKDGFNRILDWFLQLLPQKTLFQAYEKNRRIQGFTAANSPVHIEISTRETNDDVVSVNVEMFGSRSVLRHIQDMLDEDFEKESATPMIWWHKGDRGVSSRKVFLPPLTTRIVPELYPDMQPDPATYIKSYLDSDASILLMAGPPGTGKTTLLRHMIKDHDLGAHVIYDEGLMSNDNIFQNFLFGDFGDVMIIEDADAILCSREMDQNKLMSRFLNVSDGLIKLPNKKLVFTTNLSDFNKVDPAILRPGRCYGVLHTRSLDLNEAQAAARACQLPIPVSREQYTLAQLFNQQAKSHQTRGIGFVTA